MSIYKLEEALNFFRNPTKKLLLQHKLHIQLEHFSEII